MKFNNKKITNYLMVCFSFMLLNACSPNQSGTPDEVINTPPVQPSSQTETTQTSQDASNWLIDLMRVEIADDLRATESIQQYNGDVTQIELEEIPAVGYTFLLVELIIEKQAPGPSSFQWDQLTVIDGKGNTYSRHPNDTFLESYNFPRIKSTDLTIGRNEGFICFEIPKEAADSTLVLSYTFDEGEILITLK